MNTEPCINLWGCNLHSLSGATSSISERHEMDSLFQFLSARTFKRTSESHLKCTSEYQLSAKQRITSITLIYSFAGGKKSFKKATFSVAQGYNILFYIIL